MMSHGSLLGQALDEAARRSPRARRRRVVRRVVVDVAVTLVVAWLLMIMFGVLHAEVIRSIQPAGYGACLLLAVLGSLFGSAIVGGVRLYRRLR